eukprot:403336498
MSQSNKTSCCLPSLSFKKQTKVLQIDTKNQSVFELSNNPLESEQKNNRINNKSNIVSQQTDNNKKLADINKNHKSNKVAPKRHIIVSDSPQFSLYSKGLSTRNNTISKSPLYHHNESPSKFSDFSSMLGSPLKIFENKKNIKMDKHDVFQCPDKNEAKIDGINVYQADSKLEYHQQKQSQKTYFLECQQDVAQLNSYGEKTQNIPSNEAYLAKQSSKNYQYQKQQNDQHENIISFSIQSILGENIELQYQRKYSKELKCNKTQTTKFQTQKQNQLNMIASETNDLVNKISQDFNIEKQLIKVRSITPILIDDNVARENMKKCYTLSKEFSQTIQDIKNSYISSFSHCSLDSVSVSNSSVELSYLNDKISRQDLNNQSNKSHSPSSFCPYHKYEKEDHSDNSSICRFGSSKQQKLYNLSNTTKPNKDAF